MALPRVLFVTGKGGTGKSTVSAALAVALARRRPTTLVDLDRRMSAAAILGATPNLKTPSKISDSLSVIALQAHTELESFIDRIVPVRAISKRMLRSRTFGYVSAALPGLEAFLLLERMRIMGGDAALEDTYVVIDAPASGSALELLSVAANVKGIAPAGSLNRIADAVSTFLLDATRFGVIVTCSPEELAIREALETTAAIRARGIMTIAALMNQVPDSLFETADLAALSPYESHAKLAIARHAAREKALIGARRLVEDGLDTVVLPMLFTEAIGAKQVSELGDILEVELLD
jgi:MinD-like ATPase involved in chromosome partitioning or flagellar assembly